MEHVNYDDFKNICRVCLLTCNNKFSINFIIVSKIYYMLMGIQFNTNDQLPQQICLKCYQKIVEIDAFESQCKQAHSSLMKCLQHYKNEGLNATIQVTNEYFGIEDITIEEHKIEFVKDEENFFNDELDIKTENTEETSTEIIDYQNSVQDDFHENVKIEEMSQDNMNQNDLNDDRNSDSTSINQLSSEISDLKPETLKLKKMLNVHKRKQRLFECEICNKKFKQSAYLKRHKTIHSSERRYSCEICNKSFNYVQNLKIHKRVHSGERPYACEICKKTFTQVPHLNAHKRIHSGERPYTCEICNKTFIQSSDLKKHKRIHSGECPFVCEVCNKKFKYTNALKAHKRLHSSERLEMT